MRIICGGDTGLFKVVNPETNKVVLQWGEQKRLNSITHMVWADPSGEGELVAAHQNGIIDTYLPSTGDKRFTFHTGHKLPVSGLYSFNSDNRRNIIICTEKGHVEVHSFAMDEIDSSTNIGETKVSKFSVPGPVSVMKAIQPDSNTTYIAIAGKDNLLKLYDVNTQQAIYKSKNLPNDFLDMAPPIYDRDLCFMDKDANVIATCTGYAEVRQYDRRVGMRPIMKQKYGEESMTKIIKSPLKDNEVIFGTVNGGLYKLDFDNRKFAKYRMIAGSVRGIMPHPTMDYLGVVSSDRHLRVYNTKTRELLYLTYLIQRQNCILFTSDTPIDPNDVDDDDDEKDDVWEELEELEKEQKKRKREAKSDEKKSKKIKMEESEISEEEGEEEGEEEDLENDFEEIDDDIPTKIELKKEDEFNFDEDFDEEEDEEEDDEEEEEEEEEEIKPKKKITKQIKEKKQETKKPKKQETKKPKKQETKKPKKEKTKKQKKRK